MMRLVYITNQICGPGGLERVLSVKTAYLINTYGYEIHIITLNQKTKTTFYDFHPEIKYHNIEAKGNSLQYAKSYISGLREYVKAIKPSFISVCDDGLKGFFVPIFLKKPCPMIYERHVSKNIENKSQSKSFLKKLQLNAKFRMMNFGARFYDSFVVLTDGNKKEWPTKNMVVIPNPLPFYPETASEVTSKKIISVGKLAPQKGYDLLIEAWAKIAPMFPEWKVSIFGKGNEETKLKTLIKEYSLENSFSIYPPTQEIQEKYLGASLYVMSSRFEGFGMVLIEAMACGLPCVSFDCPFGPSDIISHNDDGLIAKNGNVDDLAEKMTFLIENSEQRKKMGTKAKENVRKYLPENIVRQWHELFNSLTKEANLQRVNFSNLEKANNNQ
ncbi:glycosyltransferase family 4 protein [Galbibacter mesophilus]|uniref:glycosyltransferase family 4 protein n=1 Tax=Galbibacter mesophilus TaxID=379069 RepID=UPI00191D0B55|nr:glycosyltransferase family 4 protein [Galbibacter mesophilus]MCM5663416.1 glycosyltransferase family 4 protein [Galbibacter mesophilus]